MKLTLSEILKIPSLQAHFDGDRSILQKKIAGISIDSRTVKQNELFVAIIGEKFDAHEFIPDVLEKQVLGLIVEKRWLEHKRMTGNFIVVDDTLDAFQVISQYYRDKFDIPVVAITGSNGKTTTKEMIASVLSSKYSVLKNKGNLNNHIGVPISLFNLDETHQMAVIEMGANHFGEIKRLAEIAKPGFGIITNIGPAHLEFFGSLDGVAREKTDLWRYLEKNEGVAFVNVDDKYLSGMIPKTSKVITYGFEKDADVKGVFLGSDEFGNARFQVMGKEIKLQVVGMHNIYNALAAVSVGLEFNLNIDQVSRTLNDFLPTSKRMEIFREKGIVIINDCYNSNPLSAEKSLITLVQMKTKGRRIAVLADMLELGQASEQFHREIGDTAAKLGIDYLLTFGTFSKHTVHQAQKNGLRNAVHFEDKNDLIAILKKLIREHDVVLVKGSRGMMMEQVTDAILNSNFV